MVLKTLEVPESIKQLPHFDGAENLIDSAQDAIDAFLSRERLPIENFVTSDYRLLDQALNWIEQNHLATGNRFCEWGAGFGVGAMLAGLHGMMSFGMEIESDLVEQANRLADLLGSPARIFHGSLVPRGVEGIDRFFGEVRNVDTEAGDVYQEMDYEISDFDLIFAFPWPGEQDFFEYLFDACAAEGALLLTYRGRDGMHLVRKVR